MENQKRFVMIIQTLKGRREDLRARSAHSTWIRKAGLFFVVGVLDILIVLCAVPFTLRSTPTGSFQKLARFSPDRGFIDSYTNHIRYYRASVGAAILAGVTISLQIISVAGLSLLTLFGNPQPTKAAGENLIGLWAGGAAPSGWTCVSCGSGDFYQKFIRGASTYGATAGAATHTHSISWASSTTSGVQGVGTGGNTVAGNHSHASITSSSMDGGTLLPVYQNIKVIRYDTEGTPATLPTGFIGMFDVAPPSGWTQISTHDGDFLRGENDATTTGGADTHTHTNTSVTTGGPSGLTGNVDTLSPGLSGPTHTHSGSGTTASGDHTPLYRDVILASADGDTTVPDGMLAMWDATPDSDWDVLSDAADIFDGRFLQANSSYGGSGGSATHTHSNLGIVTGGATGATGDSGFGTARYTATSHTHTITVSFGTANNLPPYVDVIIAKYNEPVVGVTISGTAYTDTGTTPLDGSGINKTVNLRVNGAGAYTTEITTADGAWSISGVSLTSSDVVTVYLAGESEQATTVYVSDGTAQSNIDLYQNRVIVRADTGNITNANLATGDDGDADVVYTVVSSNLTVDSGVALHVWTGDTYAPGGTVTTQGSANLHVDDSATATLATTGNTIAGDAVVDAGATLNLNADTSIDGGDITTSSTGAVATSGTPTVTMHGTGSIGGGGGSIAFYNLTIGDATAAGITAESDFSVANVLDVDTSDSLDIASGKNVTMGSSATVTLDGSITGAGRLVYANTGSTFPTSGTVSSVVRFDASAGDITVPARTYGGDVELYSTSATNRNAILGTSAGQTITVSGDYLLIADGTASMDSYNVTYNPTMVIGGSIDFTGAGSGSEHIQAGTSSWTMSGGIDTTGGNCYATSSDFTFDGSGTVNIGSDTVNNLTVSGTYTFAPGTLTGVNGTLDLTGSTTTFTGSSVWMKGTNGIIIGDGQAFSTLYIGNGSDTITASTSDFSVTVNLNILNASDTLSIDSGRTVTLTGTLTVPGTISGAGRLTYANAAAFPTTGTISSIVRFDATNTNQTMSVRTYGGDVEVVSTSTGSARTVTMANGVIPIAGSLTLAAEGTQTITLDADTNDAYPAVGGNLDFTGSGAGSENILSGGQTWLVSGSVDLTGGTYIVSGVTMLTMDGAGVTLTTAGNTLRNLTISGGTVTLGDALTLDSDFVMTSGSLDADGNAMDIAGDWAVSGGTFTHNSNTVTFDSGATGKTIETNTSPFYNVVMNNAAGGWTIQTNDMTVAGDLTLTAANAFIVASGRTLEVQGNFINSIPGATTWTGSTLYMNGSGGLQTINTKGSGDTYATLRVGASEDVAMWDSSAGTVTIDAGGCLLSQDDAGTDGRLHIYGACNSRANEYWSYATDFDGTALGGSSRQADVRFASGASFTVDSGDTLTILGQGAGANRTAITRQSAGNFGITVNGTINARYYDIDYLNASGLNIASTATVSQLSDGSFDNNGSGANSAYITVSGISSTKNFSTIIFDSASDGPDLNVTYNVNADGSGIAWTFTAAAGTHAGESYDREVNGASVTWGTALSEVSDGLSGDSQYTNSSTQLSGNWAVTDETGIDHYLFAIGTSQGASDIKAFTNVGVSTIATANGLSLTNGTTYYVTVRALDSGNNIIDEASSDGITVDTQTATFSNVSASVTDTTATITWTSSEGTSSKVEYGTTVVYGSNTTEDATLVTSHSVTITGLTSGQTYHYRVIGSDRAGNTTTGTDKTFTTDHEQATVITNTQSTVLSPTSVEITWTTNHPADSKVRYGLTTAYGQEVYDATLVTSHSITLTDLSPGVTYHYEVLSVGNTSTNDADATFTPNAEDTDSNLIVPNMVELNGTDANDGVQFVAVTVLKAGTLTISGEAEPDALLTLRIASPTEYTTTTWTDSEGTWSVEIPVSETGLDLGGHTVFATVTKNGVTSEEIKIGEFTLTTAAYLPSPTILTPEGDATTIESRPMITGLARSGNTVHIYIDDARVATVQATTHSSGTGSFGFHAVNNLSAGTHTLYAVAVSGDSASRNSPITTFTVESPFIGITFLRASVVAAQPEPYIAFEGIGAGGSRVELFLNDEPLDRIGLLHGHDSVEHFTYKLYANNLVPKDYTLYAIAYDDNGKASRISNMVRFTKSSDVAATILVTSLGTADVPQQPVQRVPLPTAIGPGPGGTYTVQSGDSLWKIAQEQLGNGARYRELIVLNQSVHPELVSNPGAIYTGWVLRLP